MRSSFFYGVGGVLSADIAVPEHERELRFYSRVLTTGAAPLWQKDLTNNQGTPIIGLGERIPEYESLPLQWMPHFQVADVATSAAQTLALGGKELFHAKGDNGQSQWAVLVDPAGAAFGVIPVVEDASNDRNNDEEIGCIAWLSLVVPDASLMCEFYQQVIGWSAAPADHAGGFEMRGPNAVTAAEICPLNNAAEGIPPVWILTLPVNDFEESLRQVSDAGGEVVKKMTEAGRAVIRDPIGVYLALQGKRS